VVPADQLDDATHDLITRATRGSAMSKALGKHGFYAQVDLPQDKAYAYAIEVMAAAALTPDSQEGIAAFLEKRAARY
jgi:enoyl-CoA hydratase/carnithine racemase